MDVFKLQYRHEVQPWFRKGLKGLLKGLYRFFGLSILLFFFSAQAVNAQTRLLVLGDSLSAAYGLPTEQGWVPLLQQKLDAQTKEIGEPILVVNASLSGETTSGGLQRLPALLKQHSPRYVMIELGANDALRGQNLQITQRNLARMIEQSQQAGAKVWLLGIRLPTNYGPAYDAALGRVYSRLAEQYQVPLDPFFLEEVALDPDLMQDDALHPNAQAQPLILNRVWRLIENTLTTAD